MANSEAADDKVQISTSDLAKAMMRSAPMKSYFNTDRDAIKFATAVALANDLKPVADEPTMVNAQRATDLDADGSLRILVIEATKTTTPYRMVEQLAEAGFRHIKKCLDERMMFEDLI